MIDIQLSGTTKNGSQLHRETVKNVTEDNYLPELNRLRNMAYAEIDSGMWTEGLLKSYKKHMLFNEEIVLG